MNKSLKTERSKNSSRLSSISKNSSKGSISKLKSEGKVIQSLIGHHFSHSPSILTQFNISGSIDLQSAYTKGQIASQIIMNSSSNNKNKSSISRLDSQSKISKDFSAMTINNQSSRRKPSNIVNSVTVTENPNFSSGAKLKTLFSVTKRTQGGLTSSEKSLVKHDSFSRPIR
ncbi:hypothetical protein SteCoe_23396 [Stentor coeruleus]|uniref:Uncharacterized protein n=1 Tax=Stentor coeruleus TaxID=5963 RepID=A0A1R2BJY1_9CILI|nr:hypothetical protein SteCoe_23396 [Stentor coeruleus]